MQFESTGEVSTLLEPRIKLEEPGFNEIDKNGSNCQMYYSSPGSSVKPPNLWEGLNGQNFHSNSSGVINGHYNNFDSNYCTAHKDQNQTVKQEIGGFSGSMNNNFVCPTMLFMNETLQPSSSLQAHNLKKQDIFNMACEKGCNCEAASNIFRAGHGLMFSPEKHITGKHFMTSCGPLPLTPQECGEFLLKKAAASNGLVITDRNQSLHQPMNNQHGSQQPNNHNHHQSTVSLSESSVQVNNGMKLHGSGQKYRVDKERPFSCQECGKTFLLKHHLVTHARVHTGERPHVCTECGKSFAHKHCLSTHLLLHTSDRPYKCPECKKSFTLKHHLVTHALVHSRDRPYVCQECGRTFPQKRHLVTHSKFHSGERPFVCEECGESFSQKEHLVVHSRFHGGQQAYTCQDCGRTFARKFELVNHGRLHGRLPYSCDVCGKEFLQKRTLLAHARLHSPEECSFTCQHCGETFAQKQALMEHSRVHNPDKQYSCRQCGSCFSTIEGLSLHERLHLGDHNVMADLCGLASALQQPAPHFLCSSNTKHGVSMNKPKPFVCPDCGKGFAQKHGLIQHQKRHSNGSCEIRQHVCDKCGKAFFQKNHLALHSKQHADLRSADTALSDKRPESYSAQPEENRGDSNILSDDSLSVELKPTYDSYGPQQERNQIDSNILSEDSLSVELKPAYNPTIPVTNSE